MHNIPDFALQLQEISKQLQIQANITDQDWKDKKKEEYFDAYVTPLIEYIDTYINGGNDMSGKGVNDLMDFLAESMDKMEDLTGIPADVQFECAAIDHHNGGVNDAYGERLDVENMSFIQRRGGIVHNSDGERDYWSSWHNGPRPGQLSPSEIENLYEKK